MVTDADEDLDVLLELSDVDAQRARIDAQLADLPEQRAVEEAEERLEAAIKQGDALRVEVTTVEAEQRRHEREIEQFQTRIAKEQERLYGGGITNAKEMQSVESEIDAAQRRVDEHELELLEAMEAADDLAARIDEAARTAEQTRAEIVELEAARDKAAQDLMAQKAELDVERDKLRHQLGGDAIDQYDGIRERIPAGVAVGELSGMSCTACRIDLPYAEVNELRDGDTLTTCPNCRRLLVVR